MKPAAKTQLPATLDGVRRPPVVLHRGRIADDAEARVVRGDTLDGATTRRMLAVLQAAFGTWPPGGRPADTALDHLRWKLEGQPGLPTFATLIEVDGELAGVMLSLRSRCRAQGVDYEIEIGSDRAIHPAHQGRGLNRARRIYSRQNVERWLDFEIGFSHHPAVLSERARQAREIRFDEPRVLTRVLDRHGMGSVTPSTLRGVARSVALPAAQVAGKVADGWRIRDDGRVSIRHTDAFDEGVDRLFEEGSRAFDLVGVRDARFLNWRYADARAGRYRLLAAEEEGDLVGFAVVGLSGERAYLADLFTPPERLAVAAALLEEAIAEVRRAAIPALVAWVTPRHATRRLLRSFGFFDTRRSTGISIQPFRIDPTRLAFLGDRGARVHLSPGDSDFA